MPLAAGWLEGLLLGAAQASSHFSRIPRMTFLTPQNALQNVTPKILQKLHPWCQTGCQNGANIEPKSDVSAPLSKTKTLKDVSNEITTFLVQDPLNTDSESKPKTALENNAPKSHPTSENCFILDPHWAPQEGTNLSRRHQNCECGILWEPSASQMRTQTLQKPNSAPILAPILNFFIIFW